MYCKHCGIVIDDDSKFCYSCGKQQMQPASSTSTGKTSKNQVIDKLEKDPLENEIDLLYQVNNIYLGFGICLIILVAGVNIWFQLNDAENETIYLFNGMMMVVKIIFAISVSREARRVSRNAILWGILTFFFTGIVLIIYGSKREKLLPKDWNDFSDKDKSKFLGLYANKLVARAGHLNKALYMIDRAQGYDKNNASIYVTRSTINWSLKDFASSLKDLDKAIEIKGDVPKYYYKRGYIHLKLGNKKEAFTDWTKAYEMGYKEANEPIQTYCKEFIKENKNVSV